MEQTFVDTTAGIRALPMLELQQRQLQEQRRYREEIARERAEQNRIRRDEAAAKFGPYAVMGPDGELDIQGSARAQQAAAQAAKLGEAEALSGQSFADIPEDIRGLPEYRQGWASGMATRAMEEERFGRQAALLAQRGQTAEDVARIREAGDAWNAATRFFGERDKAAADDVIDVEETLGDGIKSKRKIPASKYPAYVEGVERRKREKPIRGQINAIDDALAKIENTKGNTVDLTFSDGEIKVTKPIFGGASKAEARRDLLERKRNLQGLLGRTVGEQEDERPTGTVPEDVLPRTPRGTNPPPGVGVLIPSPAAAGIVQPRGTNIFNAVRDPSGGWIIGRPAMTY